MTDKPCFVYMMWADAPIWPNRCREGFAVFKVGVSDNPGGRLASIQTSSPFAVNIVSRWLLPSRNMAMAIERIFHAGNAHERLSGEWFYGNPTGAILSVDHLICDYAVEVLHLDPARAVDFIAATAEMPGDYARDIVVAQYGANALA